MGDRSAEKELDGKEYQWKRYALLYLLFSQRRKSDKILAAMMYSIIPEGGGPSSHATSGRMPILFKVPSRTGEGQKEE